MKIPILCEPEQISPRLEYTLDFIFNTIGYNWKMVSFKDSLAENEVIVGYLPVEKSLDYLDFNIINIPNFNLLQDLAKAESQLTKLTIGSEIIPILGKRPRKKNLNDWQKNTRLNYFYKKNYKTWYLEYDLILNTFYHLSRYEERWRNFVDESESDWAKSVLSRAGELQLPVINILLNHLQKVIELKSRKINQPTIRVLNWPKGEDFGVAFTHDIDITRGVPLKDQAKAAAKMALNNLKGKKEKNDEIKKVLNEKNELVWSFDKILKFYKQYEWKSTFFFIAKLFEGRHLRYNITSEKYRQLFKKLKTAGHEVALHPSLKSFDNPKNYSKEKKKLEKYSQVIIKGMRQHYLRAKYPRLWEFANRSGMKYDSSLGYNFKSGFRSGTCSPHQTYNYSTDQQLNIVEFPLAFFEYNLPEKGENENKSIETINSLLAQVNKYGGLLTVLVHPSNFLQKPFSKYWQYLTTRVLKKKIFVATLSDHLRWFFSRKEIKIKIEQINSKQLQVEIKKPKEVNCFSFAISPDGEFEQKSGVKIEQLKRNMFYCTSNLVKFKLIFNTNLKN